MKLTDQTTDTWRPHPRCIDALEVDKWTLRVKGVDLLANAKFHHGYTDRIVWQSLTKVGPIWFRVRIALNHNSAVAQFWIWPVYGDTGDGTSLFPRRQLYVTSLNAPLVDMPVEEDGDFILHGQGVSMRYLWVDFDQVTSDFDSGAILKPNALCPQNPNQTGGNWPYMGITFPPRETFELEELYMLGGYGGYFQHECTGEWVTEKDKPDLQANSHIHEFSKDPGWINYTNPDATWQDRMAIFQANQDGQHCCLWSVLAQAAKAHYRKEGLQMLLEAAVHVYTRAFPDEPRGTTHHDSGQERGQGRILKSAVDMNLALRDKELALVVGIRGVERYRIDMQAALKRLQSGMLPFAPFLDGYSTNEIGIHYWGMWKLAKVLESVNQLDVLPILQHWLALARAWCFESFRWYDIPGDRRWAYPYVEAADHTEIRGGVSSAHFGWLAATHYEPQNPTEIEKMKAILELGDHYPARFKG